jgi:hypothetical protein
MAKFGYIGNQPDASPVIVARQYLNATGSVGIVTFASGYTPGYFDVYLNGVKLQDAVDYTATDGRVVNFITNATTGDVVEMVAYKAFTIGASNIGVSSAGTTIVNTGVQTLNFIGAGNTFRARGNTVDVSIESVGVSSAGEVIANPGGVQTLNFIGAGNTFLVRGSTVDVSIEGGGAIGVSSNTFDSLTGAGFTHFNFIGAAVTALGTGDVGGAKTAVVTINKTFTIGTRAGVQNINVTSGIATIGLRTTTDPSGVGTIRF